MFSKELIEGIKQFIRVALMGAVSYLLTAGVLQGIITALFGSKIDPALIVIITALLTSVLSALDKFLHENDVKTPLDMDKGFIDSLKK